MKKLLFTTILVMLIFQFSSGQSWPWVQRGGSTEQDKAKFISIDSSGNSYVVGTFRQMIFAGPNNLISRGGDDIFIAKYDPLGNLVWAHSGGGVGDDGYSMSCSTDSLGNTIVAAASVGTVYFEQFTLNNVLSDITLLKYDSNGNLVFAKSFGGNSNDIAIDVKLDQSGNFYVTGFFQNTANFGGVSLTSSGLTEIYLAKYDENGNLIWVRKAGGTSYDAGTGIAMDKNNHVFLTGYYNLNTNFDGIVLNNSGGDDVFFACYDTAGTIQWVKSANGVGSYDIGNKIGCDNSGNIYAIGQFSNTLQFDTISITSAGMADVFIAKLNSLGNYEWVKSYGGISDDIGYDIRVRADGSQYYTGYFSDSAIFEASTLISNGGTDIFIAKNFTDGSMHWIKQNGGIGNDIASSISVLTERDCFVAGSFTDTVSFDNLILQSAGAIDFFVGRIDAPTSDIFTPDALASLHLFPNPVGSGQTININLSLDFKKDFLYVIFNGIGKEVQRKHLHNSMGTATIDLPQLSEGIYFIRLISGDGKSLTAKFLVQD